MNGFLCFCVDACVYVHPLPCLSAASIWYTGCPLDKLDIICLQGNTCSPVFNAIDYLSERQCGDLAKLIVPRAAL